MTQPADLARVAAVLAPVAPLAGAAADTAPRDGDRAIRVGLGTDSHPFGPGDDLALGGLRVPGGPRLHGHSDGDVVLHAIADALLGGAALGDLGRLFPAGPETPRGIASAEMLDGVRERVIEAGWAVDGIDATIVAGRPKLAPHLPAMAARIAEILGIDVGAVNVKASTGNLDGADGAGRGITATAIATLSRARTGGPT